MEELGGGDGVTWWDNPLGTHGKNLQRKPSTDLTETKEERLVFSLGYRGFSPRLFGCVDSEPHGTGRA